MGISFKWESGKFDAKEKEEREKEIIDYLQGCEISPCHPGGQILVRLNKRISDPLGMRLDGIFYCECGRELMTCRADLLGQEFSYTLSE